MNKKNNIDSTVFWFSVQVCFLVTTPFLEGGLEDNYTTDDEDDNKDKEDKEDNEEDEKDDEEEEKEKEKEEKDKKDEKDENGQDDEEDTVLFDDEYLGMS